MRKDDQIIQTYNRAVWMSYLPRLHSGHDVRCDCGYLNAKDAAVTMAFTVTFGKKYLCLADVPIREGAYSLDCQLLCSVCPEC